MVKPIETSKPEYSKPLPCWHSFLAKERIWEVINGENIEIGSFYFCYKYPEIFRTSPARRGKKQETINCPDGVLCRRFTSLWEKRIFVDDLKTRLTKEFVIKFIAWKIDHGDFWFHITEEDKKILEKITTESLFAPEVLNKTPESDEGLK